MSDRPTPEQRGYRIGRDVKPTRFRPVLYANGEGFAGTDAADAWRDGYNAAIRDIFGEPDDE